MAQIEVQGLDRLMKKLQALGGDADKALSEGLMQAGKMVQASAKAICPVDTGQLKNSIAVTMEEDYSYTYRSRERENGVNSVGNKKYTGGREFSGHITGGGERTVVVGTNVEHAIYNEFGTGKRGDPAVEHREDWKGKAPTPFLAPALQNNKEQIVTRIRNNIRRAIKKAGGVK